MSNFQFLHKEWPAIYREANEAEQANSNLSKGKCYDCKISTRKDGTMALSK